MDNSITDLIFQLEEFCNFIDSSWKRELIKVENNLIFIDENGEVVGILEILTLIFIVLKLCGVIAWSWWFVLLPEIIAFALYILAIVITVFTGKKVSKKIEEF